LSGTKDITPTRRSKGGRYGKQGSIRKDGGATSPSKPSGNLKTREVDTIVTMGTVVASAIEGDVRALSAGRGRSGSEISNISAPSKSTGEVVQRTSHHIDPQKEQEKVGGMSPLMSESEFGVIEVKTGSTLGDLTDKFIATSTSSLRSARSVGVSSAESVRGSSQRGQFDDKPSAKGKDETVAAKLSAYMGKIAISKVASKPSITPFATYGDDGVSYEDDGYDDDIIPDNVFNQQMDEDSLMFLINTDLIMEALDKDPGHVLFKMNARAAMRNEIDAHEFYSNVTPYVALKLVMVCEPKTLAKWINIEIVEQYVNKEFRTAFEVMGARIMRLVRPVSSRGAHHFRMAMTRIDREMKDLIVSFGSTVAGVDFFNSWTNDHIPDEIDTPI